MARGSRGWGSDRGLGGGPTIPETRLPSAPGSIDRWDGYLVESLETLRAGGQLGRDLERLLPRRLLDRTGGAAHVFTPSRQPVRCGYAAEPTLKVVTRKRQDGHENAEATGPQNWDG